MGFKYKFYIDGNVFDLIPNYPQEDAIDIGVLDRLCYMIRLEQENVERTIPDFPHSFEDYKGYVENILKTRQDEIISDIHRDCYRRTYELPTVDVEEILFQYLFQSEKLSLSEENRQKILHFYSLVETSFRGTLLSPYGAILLGEEKMTDLLATILLKKEMQKKNELKTPFINGRELLLMRDEYPQEVKHLILNSYSDDELFMVKEKLDSFYRGLSLAIGLEDLQKEAIKKDFETIQKEPFHQEFIEAQKILPLNQNNHLLLKAARVSCLLQGEIKERIKYLDNKFVKTK